MRIIAFLILLFSFVNDSRAQYTYFTAALPHDTGNPSSAPSQSGSRLRIDQPTRRLWVWNETSLQWVRLGQGIDVVTGCIAPSYTPTVGQSNFAINGCTPVPGLYYHTGGGTWLQVNVGSGGTVTTDATLDGDGSGGDPLKIAQQSATSSEVLTWTGATWEPTWGNPYTYVTSGATITTAVNEILIGTLSSSVTFGLPTCDATTDGKHFKFVRNGTDAFSVTIDPAGAQQFADGTSVKISYDKLSMDCTCRFSGTGIWFFDNF